jgi:hypothetical protein
MGRCFTLATENLQKTLNPRQPSFGFPDSTLMNLWNFRANLPKALKPLQESTDEG